MSRLIDADAYAEEMKKRQDKAVERYKKTKDDDKRNSAAGSFLAFTEAKLTLDKMPTVDAVQVVRCKDCKYADKRDNWCEEHDMSIANNFFCSWGERKEKE